jgi:hypothetical protein
VQRPAPEPPAEVVAAARERAAARAARDWPRADTLRAEIEAAGWKVIDRGTGFDLEPAAPPTVEEAGITRYGSSSAVPSTLAERPTARFTVALVADDRSDDPARLLAGLRTHAPVGTQVVVVANEPAAAQAERLAAGSPDLAPIGDIAPEVTWTSVRLGHAAACNVALRRARGEVVVLADPSVELLGDALTPLADALADPAVAVCGAFGLVAADLRRFMAAPGPAVDVIELPWLAFRRADYLALGPLDEKLVVERHLDTWWSLVLRAGAADRPPRGARRLDLPLRRHAPPERHDLPAAELERLARRSFYRVLDRFRDRPDLLSGAPAP